MTADQLRWLEPEQLHRTHARTAELWRRAAEVMEASAWIRGDRSGREPTLSLQGVRLVGCCAWCGRLRNRSGLWAWVPERLRPPEVQYSHTICPACWELECPHLAYPG